MLSLFKATCQQYGNEVPLKVVDAIGLQFTANQPN